MVPRGINYPFANVEFAVYLVLGIVIIDYLGNFSSKRRVRISWY
jgi:hypothetical protein